jgi:hypothetical protein
MTEPFRLFVKIEEFAKLIKILGLLSLEPIYSKITGKTSKFFCRDSRYSTNHGFSINKPRRAEFYATILDRDSFNNNPKTLF